MKHILIFLLITFSLFAGESRKVVIDLTTGDAAVFEQKILSGIVAHKNHYADEFKELDVAVVIHGQAYKFFLKNPANSTFRKDRTLLQKRVELGKRIAALADTYEVEFLMCAAGMKKHKIDKKDVYDFVATVPNAGIGLIDKQNIGYAYLPIN